MAGETGLLDWLNTPAGQGLLATAAGAAASAGRGRGFLGNIGAGGLMGLQAYTGAQENATKSKYMDAQMANLTSEVETRKAALAKQKQVQDMMTSLFNGGSTPAGPGQLGSGSFGIVPTAAGQPAIPTPRSGLAGASIDQIAALHAAGGPDLLNAYKLAREGFERKPGSFYESIDGRREYVSDPTKGITFQNGRVGLLPGFTDATAATTLATEAPKALLASAGRVNLRPNADGTQSPVSELSENPTLQNVLGNLFPGGFGGATRPAATQPAPRNVPAGVQTVVSPADQRAADAESIRMIQAELQNPNLPADQRAGLQREVARLTQAQTQTGFPKPTMIRNPQGYGKTAEQEARDAALKAGAVKQAEADVVPTEQRQNQIASGTYMLSVIDRALNHPGLPTATGLSGSVDPRNYVPGTEAKDFQAIHDQLVGNTFLQAYASLKGGGQITEVEGKKAQDAIARLNRAQSTDAYKEALLELRGVVASGLERQQKGQSAASQGGATGGWDQPASKPQKAPPVPMKGMVRNGYRFKGGDPASPASWEKA